MQAISGLDFKILPVTWKKNLWVPRGDVWDGHVYTVIFKMDSQQGLTVQHSAQCYVPAWMGGGLGENGYTYMYG